MNVLVRRLAIGAVSVLAAGFLACPGTSMADEVGSYDQPTGPNHGTTKITAANGYITTAVVGRLDAKGEYCKITAGSETKRMTVDSRGDGSVRFGPLQRGTYRVFGWCYSHSDGGYRESANPGVATVRIDGSNSNSCSDGIQRIMDDWGLTGQVEDQLQSIVTKRGVETTFQQACAIIDVSQPENWVQQPGEIFQSFCRVGRSLVPAEIVYRLAEEAGKATKLTVLEQIAAGAGRSWAKQCE